MPAHRPARSPVVDGGHLAPAFVIVGAQKSGTTSLFNYLEEHPHVAELALPAPDVATANMTRDKWAPLGNKEIRFFDGGSAVATLADYYSLFPTVESLGSAYDERMITGEATPNYMYNANTAAKIHEALPHAKIIALLRNPTERARSHFQHLQYMLQRRDLQIDVETLLMQEREALFECGITNATSFQQSWPDLRNCYDFQIAEYARSVDSATIAANKAVTIPMLLWAWQLTSRGLYAMQLAPYFKLFGKENVLVLRSEDLFEQPVATMERVADFLGLEAFDWSRVVDRKYNFGEDNKIIVTSAKDNTRTIDVDARMRAYLDDFFEPFNRDLINLMRIHELPWTAWPTASA